MPATGIGGFFRSDDPGFLLRCYQEHLGIGIGSGDLAGTDRPIRRSLRARFHRPRSGGEAMDAEPCVPELDRLLQELAAAGIVILRGAGWDTPGTGRFACRHDREGDPTLWEPPAA